LQIQVVKAEGFYQEEQVLALTDEVIEENVKVVEDMDFLEVKIF
jgi:hypothetical protein